LRRLTIKLAAAILAVAGGYYAARLLAPATGRQPDAVAADALPSPSAPVEPAAIEAAASGDGEKLVLMVLETLERRPNIAAKVRQSMRVGKERLTGEGDFWQQGLGNQRRTRWELKTALTGDTAFVTQVCDGDHVWTDRKLAGDRHTTRIDVTRVRRELAAADSPEQGRGTLTESQLLLVRGGLSQLVADLHRCFVFGPEQTLRRGDRTVKAVVGQWRPEQLERQWPGLVTSAEDWPSHLPHHALLYVDNDDWFPYLVEYRSGSQAELASSNAAYLPSQDALAEFEFVEVQFAAAMPANLFEFTPPENDWHDVTARLVEQLRPPAPKLEETAARRSGTWR
jgi:hypothetical protein